MKILHTSDWHLGHVLYNYDRTAEQGSFLRQLAIMVATEQPDVMVVCGDVFHTPVPSAAAQRMYNDAMLEIHNQCPDMPIIVTAGNHDSGNRLEVTGELWKHFRLTVIGGIQRKPNGKVDLGRHIVRIGNKGYVVAVPHVYPQNFPSVAADTPREQRMQTFFQALLDKTAKENASGLPVVLTAHLAVTGADISGHETGIGGMDYFPIGQLGKGYSYLALGHIHCPQTLKQSEGTARYSGSPLPVNFDEGSYPHSVSVVEIGRFGQRPEIREIKVDNPMPFLSVPKHPVPFEEALSELKKLPGDKKCYVRLNVRITDFLPSGCNEQVSEIVKDKKCKFCYIRPVRETDGHPDSSSPQMEIEEFRTLDPVDLAKLYWQIAYGDEMDEKYVRMLKSAISSIGAGNENPDPS